MVGIRVDLSVLLVGNCALNYHVLEFTRHPIRRTVRPSIFLRTIRVKAVKKLGPTQSDELGINRPIANVMRKPRGTGAIVYLLYYSI